MNFLNANAQLWLIQKEKILIIIFFVMVFEEPFIKTIQFDWKTFEKSMTKKKIKSVKISKLFGWPIAFAHTF